MNLIIQLACCSATQMTNGLPPKLRPLFLPIYENINLIPGPSLFSVSVKIIIIFGKIKHYQSLYFIINTLLSNSSDILSQLDKAGWVKYDICSKVCDLTHIYLGWLGSSQPKHSKAERRSTPFPWKSWRLYFERFWFWFLGKNSLNSSLLFLRDPKHQTIIKLRKTL